MKIPRGNTGGTRLTTQSGVAPKDPGQMSQVSRAVSGLGKTVEAVAQKFEDLYWDNKKNEAALATYDGVTTLDAEAKTDIDIDDPAVQAKYSDRMTALKEKVMGGIPNGAAKSDISNTFDFEALKFNAGVKAYGRTATMHKTIANAEKNFIVLGKEYTNADPDNRPEMFSIFEQKVKELETKGFWLPEKAQKEIAKKRNAWNKQAALYDAEVYGVDYVKNHMGDYDVEDKAGLIKEIHAQKKLNDARKEKARVDLQNDTIREQVARQGKGEFEPEDAEALYQTKVIDLKSRDDLIKRHYKVDVQTDYAEYNRLKERVEGLNDLDGQLHENRAKIIQEILSTKNLEPEDTEELIDRAYAVRDQLLKDVKKLETDGLKSVLMQTMAGATPLELLTGDIQGKIDKKIYDFHKQVQQENASPERIREIASDMKTHFIQESDPLFVPDKDQDYNKIKMVEPSQVVVNPTTGERMVLMNDGRWVLIDEGKDDTGKTKNSD